MASRSCGELVADVVPHGVEPGAGLLDVGGVGGLAAVDGVVEHHGILSHQVVDVTGAVGERDVVLDDRPDSSKSTRVCWMRMSGRGWSSLLSSNTGIQSKLACALRFRLMVVVRRRMLEE